MNDPYDLPVETISRDLRWLTRKLRAIVATPYQGGVLGGEDGYGEIFENEVFMMHPFCWCDRDDCPWCRTCECPDGVFRYLLADGTEVDSEAFFAAGGYAVGGRFELVETLLCDYCKGITDAEPNFRHKPSGSTVRWYKYIGRDMEFDLSVEWSAIMRDVADSLR